MTDANRKPWLTASEQIDHLKSRGVHFSLMSEDDAKAYLENNSNYFRLRVYRLGFPKVEEKVRKGVPSKRRAPPIFYDAVIGGSTYGRPVDKQLSLTKTWSIAVEAFGRHLKRVDASALFFCLDVRFGLSKLTSQLRKDEIACDFLLARNFTDALLLSLNSRRFPR